MSDDPGQQSFYQDAQRALQDEFDTRRLADVHEVSIVQSGIDDDRKAFIESRDFFFLSTVGDDGWPTVSYKGGPVGVVHVPELRRQWHVHVDGQHRSDRKNRDVVHRF
jgi:hypothetical protein